MDEKAVLDSEIAGIVHKEWQGTEDPQPRVHQLVPIEENNVSATRVLVQGQQTHIEDSEPTLKQVWLTQKQVGECIERLTTSMLLQSYRIQSLTQAVESKDTTSYRVRLAAL